MAALAAIWSRVKAVGGLLTGLAEAAFKWAGIIFAYRLGRRRERQKTAEQAVETKDKQLEIAAKPSLHRADLIERMRRRKRD